MKYFVIANKWGNKRSAIVRYIAGEFDNRINAQIFKDAYDAHYCTCVKIIESLDLLNPTQGR